MINNIFLVDLQDSDINEVKELCSTALVSIQGAEAQATFITVGSKEGKIQLRLNGSKSTTFMCVVSSTLADILEPQMPEIFKLRVMYIFESLEGFRDSINKNFASLEILTGVEESSIEKEEVEEVSEVDESDNIFMLPEVEENIEEPEYLKSKIKTLESEASLMRNEIAHLRGQQEEGYYDRELETIKELEKEIKSNLEELSELRDRYSLREKEVSTLKGKQIELSKNIKELEFKNSELESSNEELNAMVDETDAKNEKINKIVAERDSAEMLTKELADELTSARNGLDTAKSLLLEKEKDFTSLSRKWDKISSSLIARLAFKSTPKASINDIIVERSFIKDCYLIGTGSAESISDTASYIKRAIKSSLSKILVIDLTYETYVDYALRVTTTSKSNILDCLEGTTSSLESCLMDTDLRSVKYCRLSSGFINELSYLNMDWNKLFDIIEEFKGKVIIHIGYIGGVMKGIVVNSLSRFINVQMISKMTTINIRNTIITLGAINNLANLTCICIKPNSGNIPPMYDRMAKKYITRAIDAKDNISL